MGSVRFLLNFKKCFERKIALSLFEGALVVLLSLEGSALPAGSLVAQVVTTGPPGRDVLLLANCHHHHLCISTTASPSLLLLDNKHHDAHSLALPCALCLSAGRP